MKAIVTGIEVSDWLLARGKHFVTTAEVADLVGVPGASVPSSLERARESRRMIAVTKGGWVPVPPEYRDAGGPPPLHFIDPLMNHLGHPYYVGFLSAAALYGAAHQAPMVLQVATPALLRSRVIGGGRVQFIQRSAAASRATERMNVPTGRVSVSTVAITVLDLVECPQFGAGLSNVATVIGDLMADTHLDFELLALAAKAYPTAVVRRTGYLIETLAGISGQDVDLRGLEQLVGTGEYVALRPDAAPVGDRSRRWRVIVNTELEPDL